MHAYTIITSLLLAAVGTHAAAVEVRQLPPNDVIPVNVYNGNGCQGNVVRTISVPVGSNCFAVDLVATSLDSERVDSPIIPPNSGCQVVLWDNTQCSTNPSPGVSGHFVTLSNKATGNTECGTLGDPALRTRAIQLVGNCRGA